MNNKKIEGKRKKDIYNIIFCRPNLIMNRYQYLLPREVLLLLSLYNHINYQS